MTPEAKVRLSARLAAAALWSATPLAGAFGPEADGAGRAAVLREQVRQWHFTVLLDGQAIGTHDFTVTGSADDGEVDSRASFKVTAFLIPVYRYEHHDHEHWRGGCLSQIDARTRDNGHEYIVYGQSSADAFDLHGPQGAAALHGCIKTFAYWDPRVLDQQRLLNAQTGDYEPIEVHQLPRETLLVAGAAVPAEHYRLSARKFSLELWYAPSGEWLALQSRTAEGRTLRYAIRPQ